MNKKQAADMNRRSKNASKHVKRARKALKKAGDDGTAGMRTSLERLRPRDEDQFGPSPIKRDCF